MVEPTARRLARRRGARRLVSELRTQALTSPLTASIRHFLVRRLLPVDVRHNVKIAREELAVWATKRIKG